MSAYTPQCLLFTGLLVKHMKVYQNTAVVLLMNISFEGSSHMSFL